MAVLYMSSFHTKDIDDNLLVILECVFDTINTLRKKQFYMTFFPFKTKTMIKTMKSKSQFGMYSNGCGVSDWTYTGVKHHEKVP